MNEDAEIDEEDGAKKKEKQRQNCPSSHIGTAILRRNGRKRKMRIDNELG